MCYCVSVRGLARNGTVPFAKLLNSANSGDDQVQELQLTNRLDSARSLDNSGCFDGLLYTVQVVKCGRVQALERNRGNRGNMGEDGI